MDSLRELYQEVILDHNSSPRNFKRLQNPSSESEGYNPLCGDRINVYLAIENGQINDIGFQGAGCAISKASASIMTTLVKGRTVEEAKRSFDKFQKMVTCAQPTLEQPDDKMTVFAGVRQYPTRVKCASLAWHTLISAIEQSEDVVSTE